jgi:hypothetical protein
LFFSTEALGIIVGGNVAKNPSETLILESIV